jgi:Ca2+-binding RTX toxin-like protein
VTAVKEGAAKITATTADGGYTAECFVTVTKESTGGGDSPQEYYEDRYPGRNVVIAPEGGAALDGTDNRDVLVGGNGDDFLEGQAADDVYVYNRDGGYDVISNGGKGDEDRDELHFGPGIWKEDLIFTSEDNDLVITLLNSEGSEAGSVTVEGWYADEKNKLSKIVFYDGTALTQAQIEALVQNPAILLYGTEKV